MTTLTIVHNLSDRKVNLVLENAPAVPFVVRSCAYKGRKSGSAFLVIDNAREEFLSFLPEGAVEVMPSREEITVTWERDPHDRNHHIGTCGKYRAGVNVRKMDEDVYPKVVTPDYETLHPRDKKFYEVDEAKRWAEEVLLRCIAGRSWADLAYTD